MTFENICPRCGRTIEIDLPYEQVENYATGTHIQNAFSELNPAEREAIKTGYCLDCQEYLFGKKFKSDIVRVIAD